jgi:hypothetical protein
MVQPDPSAPERGTNAVDLAMSRRLARLMDDLVTVPGTSVGLGLDALIGLVPGIGDVVGSTLSGAIVYDAVRCRVPIPVLARMGWNLVLDAGLGVVPGVGDLLDVAHRANRKNLRLLEAAVAANPHPGPPSLGYLLAAAVLVVLPLVAAFLIGILALWFLVRWLVG